MRLRNVPTVRVLRREWSGAEPAWHGAATLRARLVLAGLMLWMAGDIRLGLVVLAGFLIALAFFATMARLLLAVLGRLRPAGYGYGWRHGLANLRRRLGATMVQAVALSLGLTALLLLTVARGDLLEAWQARVPANCPQPFRDQYPARSARRHRRLLRPAQAAATLAGTHGTRPPGAGEWARGWPRELC
jgi:putative ABC transport system permease protein